MDNTFPTSRLEAFSDGVIAVIITIMVLDLKVPVQKGLAGLFAIAPGIAVYALSFAFVGIYWVNHHLLIYRLRRASPKILWANLIWLFTLSLLPFFTAYVHGKSEDGFSVAIYAASLLVTAFGFMLLRLAVSARLRSEETLEHTDVALQIKHWGSMAAYLISMFLATRHPVVALGLIAAVTLLWVVPTLGVERREARSHSHSR